MWTGFSWLSSGGFWWTREWTFVFHKRQGIFRLDEFVTYECRSVEVWQVKVKLSLCFFLTEHHAMKAYWGSGGMTPRILDLGTGWRWVVSFTPRPLYPQGKSPWYPLVWRAGVPQSRGILKMPARPMCNRLVTKVTWLPVFFIPRRIVMVACGITAHTPHLFYFSERHLTFYRVHCPSARPHRDVFMDNDV
jgi:hypothetical protein